MANFFTNLGKGLLRIALPKSLEYKWGITPKPKELVFPVTKEGREQLEQRGYLSTSPKAPTIMTSSISEVLKYRKEEEQTKSVIKELTKRQNPEKYAKLSQVGFMAAQDPKNAENLWNNVGATESERYAFKGYQISVAVGGMKFVSAQEAQTIIAKVVKSTITRKDLIEITAGRLKSGVKFDAYKTMVSNPSMKKEIIAIAKNKKISPTQKISDYLKNLFKTTEVEIAGAKLTPAERGAVTGKELIPSVPKVKPVIPTISKEIIPRVIPTPKPVEMPQFKAEPVKGEPIDPIAKINELIKKSKPLKGEIKKTYTAERAKRIAKVDAFIKSTIDKVGGEEGYKMILSKLKGELISPEAKVRFEPIKDKITETELKDLFVRTWKHPYLDNFEKISAADGLTKLLSGQIPQPKQLVLLEEIYGSELVKNILSKRLWGSKAADFLVELANLPRALLATADMSAFLRQGVVPLVAHPIISAKAVAKTFQFAFSPKVFEQWFKDLPKDPLYPLMRKSKLSITDPSKAGMVEREEAFISRLLQNIPIVKIPVEFAERSYTGFLNKVRVDLFKTWADEFLSKGMSPVKDAEFFKSAATVINTFTGRGGLGSLDRITPELNIIFFSPRLISARFNALNPLWYASQPPGIRKKAISDFAKFVTVGLTTLALIDMYKKANNISDSELSIEKDTRSSDSGKIKMGNTRYDIWGGFQQWVRVFGQLITGERKNTSTGEIVSLNKEEYPFTTRKEVLLRFIENKFAPVPALVNELMSGAKTFTGEDISLNTVAKEKFVPMYIQDIADAYADGGIGRSVGAGMAAFFGIGVQTWEERKKILPSPGIQPSGVKLPPMPGIRGVGKNKLPPMPGI